MSQLGGTLIGGLALGGVGAIIGGLSGSKKQINTIKKIDLKLTVNNMKSPFIIINFFINTNGVKKTDSDYVKYYQDAQKWYSLVTILIKRADDIDNNKIISKKTPAIDKISIADEIIKLKDLKDKGILTEEEFDSQKTKLLS